jgi:enamine deaminase RidA (YjgF/YER057c/UK114 family)
VPSGAEAEHSALRYSPALRIDRTVHVSGHIGRSTDGNLPSEPEQQIREAFRSLTETLHEAGADWADVVQMTSYHVGLRDHGDAFLRVRAEYVQEPYSAWTAVGVTELYTPGALVEISLTAVVRPDR